MLIAGRPLLAGPLAQHAAELVDVYDTASLEDQAHEVSPS